MLIVVRNIFFIDVKDKGRLQDVQDKYCKMAIVGNIVFKFFMLSLDTLSLKVGHKEGCTPSFTTQDKEDTPYC